MLPLLAAATETETTPGTELLMGLATLAGLALVLYILTRVVFGGIIRRIVAATTVQWDDALIQHGFLESIALLAPAMALHAVSLIPVLQSRPQMAACIHNVANALVALIAIRVVGSLSRGIGAVYRERTPDIPIDAYLQLVNLLAAVAGVVSALALIAGYSPWAFLSGLGALSAVLMLVFKDTLLSLVACVQLGAGDMLRTGDWITVPSMGADGDVVEVGLYTVKVRNFDKTTTLIPTAKFLDVPFQNWRSMPESGGRRIKTALPIDAASVRALTSSELDALDAAGKLPGGKPAEGELVNLTAFRGHVAHVLKTSDQIHQEMTCLVRALDPSPTDGLPLELYCFTRDTDWGAHEDVRAALLERLLADAPAFGLRVLQLADEAAPQA